MAKHLPELSKIEWQIMNICWKLGKSSARDIYEETLRERKRGYQTVKTMLDRLVVKGYLAREKFGPIWLYEPAVPRAKALSREIDTFVGTVLDNTVAPFFIYLAGKERLTDEEIAALKKIIAEHGDGE